MLKFIDETLRDGPQSLWATRMKTASMLGATEWIDRSGFDRVCVASGASFETAVRFLRDDPWERLRLLRSCMPNASIDILIRSRNLFGWERYPDEVIELLFRCLLRAGVRSIKVFDGLNDMQSIEANFRIGRRLGLKVSAMLAFSLSPIHTDEHFVRKTREALAIGVDAIAMCDASGLLSGPRTKTLLAALNAEIAGRVPLEFLAHHSMGLAHDAYREAMKAGVDAVTTAATPLANGESLPATLDILAIAEELGLETSLDVDAIRRTDDYFHWVAYQEGHAVQPPARFDPVRFETFAGHQIPGGMISNFRKQLREIGMIHRQDEVLEEAARVRNELGCPIMVTPFSQFVGVQAVFNVIQGERYKTVPKELQQYVRGNYGRTPGPIDPNVVDKVLDGQASAPIDHAANFEARIVERFRTEHGPFRSDEDLLLALFYGRGELDALAREKSRFTERPTVAQPLQALIAALARDTQLKSVKFESSGLRCAFVA
jgi:oxaloacetate decarboxylase (Na+ extruding) subunit alpha